MRFNQKSLNRLKSIIALVAIILTLQITFGCSNDGGTKEVMTPIAVRVSYPKYLDMSEHLTYIGSVHATKEIPVMSQVQGTVVSVPIEEGMPINTGDLLIKLSVPDIEANVKKLEVENAYWTQHVIEDKNLFKKNAISQEQLDLSKKAFETSQASLAEVKSRLRKAREIAVFDGTVLKHFVEPGQHVMPGQSLLMIGNNKLEVIIEVVQEDINKGVQVGTPIHVITHTGNKISTKVSSIASTPTGIGRTFTVKTQILSQSLNEIRLGEALTVNLVLSQLKQVLSVPETAIFNKENKQFIFLIQENKAILTPVSLGIKQSGWVATEFEWNGVDPVAVSNITNLSDSTRVYPVKDES